MKVLPIEQIGGGRVTRAFGTSAGRLHAGTELTHEQLAAMRTANRNALIEKDFIRVWPAGNVPPTSAGAVRAERHVVALGFGRYDVIEGSKVNDKPLSREAAHALAGLPAPKKAN